MMKKRGGVDDIFWSGFLNWRRGWKHPRTFHPGHGTKKTLWGSQSVLRVGCGRGVRG
jgi:hypothetical protein